MANPIVEKAKERMTQSHQSLDVNLEVSVQAVQMQVSWIGSMFNITELILH